MFKSLVKVGLVAGLMVGSLYGGATPTTTIDNLMWEDTKNVKKNKYTYDSALRHCKNVKLDSYNDWRVPTIKELFTIVDYTKRRPSVVDDLVNTNRSGEY